ncbi:3-isopropylmalate dehydratase large subunit [Paracoccaceae bacterium]|jgi:3-isopropylmalate/(R)-2-methylmalate dehydratase large subunit|nr:3-isopropylmalate dehydratase large subunit [Paracoccaceae bacterium]
MITLAKKLLSDASGKANLDVGDIIICNVDLAMIHDSGGPRRVKPILERLNRNVWDNEKIVVVTDHYVPAKSDETRAIQALTKKWVKDNQINNFYDEQGICHVVLPERGHLTPGLFCVGGDSHSPTGGAFGAYMFGIGATEMAGVLATGSIWIKTPETILMSWKNQLHKYVTAKDMMLAMCRKIGMGGGRYQAIQFAGETIRNLPMQERMTLSNMAAELGAQAGLIAPDETTIAYVEAAGGQVPNNWRNFQIETVEDTRNRMQFDAANLSPQIAAPHSPENSDDADEFQNTAFDVAYIGACTGAKYIDLLAAAEVLKGKRIAKGVTLKVAPASLRDQHRATEDGIMQVLEDAGAEFLANSCGICAGYGEDRLAEGQVCISSTARNFKGRMGAQSSSVYLASPYTVAASAVTGKLTDPRLVMGE